MIHFTYPDGYFEKRRDLTIGKVGYWDEQQHPRAEDGKFTDGSGGATSSDGPGIPSSAAGAALVSRAGQMPNYESVADFAAAREYMGKLGTNLLVLNGANPSDVRVAMQSTRDFIEKTGLSPERLYVTTDQFMVDRFGAPTADLAQALYDPQTRAVMSSKLTALSAKPTQPGGFTIGEDGFNEAQTALWHEFGHSVHFTAHVGSPGRVPPNFRGAVESHLVGTFKAQGMSDYGVTMRAEFVAEYVSGRMMGRKFGPAVHEAYIRYGGPKLGD